MRISVERFKKLLKCHEEVTNKNCNSTVLRCTYGHTVQGVILFVFCSDSYFNLLLLLSELLLTQKMQITISYFTKVLIIHLYSWTLQQMFIDLKVSGNVGQIHTSTVYSRGIILPQVFPLF